MIVYGKGWHTRGQGGSRGSRHQGVPGATRLLPTPKWVIKQQNNGSKPWLKVPKVCPDPKGMVSIHFWGIWGHLDTLQQCYLVKTPICGYHRFLDILLCTSWPPGGAVWQLHTWNPLVLWVTSFWFEGRRFWAAQTRKTNFFGQRLKPFELPDTLTYIILYRCCQFEIEINLLVPSALSNVWCKALLYNIYFPFFKV